MSKPLQILRVHQAKHQYFEQASDQKSGPRNPHQSFRQHSVSFSLFWAYFFASGAGKVPVAAWLRACTAGAKVVKVSGASALTSAVDLLSTGSCPFAAK
jgi:hypothetical protein